MREIPEDEANFSGTIMGVTLFSPLIQHGPYEDDADFSGTITGVTLTTLLISHGPYEDEANFGGTIVGVELLDKLVSAFSPEEGIEMAFDLDPTNCSMTPI
jgi:hypothetical protein